MENSTMTNVPYKFRLSDFESYDDEETGFTVRMFAINEKGETASILAENFNPFFYVKLPDTWRSNYIVPFTNHLKSKVRNGDDIIGCAYASGKKLCGFDNGTHHNFLRISFKTTSAFFTIKNLWYSSKLLPDESKEKYLNTDALKFKNSKLELYEAHIPPILRSFHIQEVSPSGWLSLPKDKARLQHSLNAETTCKYNFIIDYEHIIPHPDDDTIVPYLKASFDIEASSSHGDFPLPIKTYRKLAGEIIDDGATTREQLKCAMRTAFGLEEYPNINISNVYPKNNISSIEVEYIIENLLNGTINRSALDSNMIKSTMVKNKYISSYFNKLSNNSDSDNDQENDSDIDSDSNSDSEPNDSNDLNDSNIVIADIFNVIESQTFTRIEKLEKLDLIFQIYFPPLEGDKVTFIGTTFMKYGNDTPLLNHCIVLGDCDQINQENTLIESYETEREVLLAWTRLIQEKDPDIIIGYNIFSFDYSFMFKRAQECNCVEEFLKLSRMKNKVCGKFDGRTGEFEIETSSMKLSNGNHNLSYIKMDGRIQIDLYYWLMRTETLSSYKLDYVSSYFIGDTVKNIVNEFDTNQSEITRVYTKNMTGLFQFNYIRFEEINNSSTSYKNGEKFQVLEINKTEKWFTISGHETPNATVVKWGLAKDDVTPKDIFRLTNEGPSSKAIVAKYCMQDCNNPQYMVNKIDVVTDLMEMSKLCSVPMSYLIFRGQGIKLTSYVAKKCREMNTFIPVIDGKYRTDGYEGAIVLNPFTGLYIKSPTAVGDYAGLYPSAMISENICLSSKVFTKFYDTNNRFLYSIGDKNSDGEFTYDNIPGKEYVDIKSNTYKYVKVAGNIKDKKIPTGHRICRFAQYPNGEKAVLPSILSELIKARKDTRKMIPKQTDEFMKNILDKRQKAIKVVANSVYGQTGAKTSTFYDMDIAASTTAVGKMLLIYAKDIIENCFDNTIVNTSFGPIRTKAKYVYGDTDSVFFNMNLHTVDTNKPFEGNESLPMSIEVAQQICNVVTKFLKPPHEFEYEKTYLPLLLLSRKRYVGIKYEFDPKKGVRNEMGIVLKRMDNAPIVKVVYGDVIDTLMSVSHDNISGEDRVFTSVEIVKHYLKKLINGEIDISKLIISKSLRAFYKKPKQIAHKVLADRITAREPGNKVNAGDRVPYIYIINPDKNVLQGDRIENPKYIQENNIPIDYSHYITNQIMKPIIQVFGLVLEILWRGKNDNNPNNLSNNWMRHNLEIKKLRRTETDEKKLDKKIDTLRSKAAKKIIFDEYLVILDNLRNKNRPITNFFKSSTDTDKKSTRVKTDQMGKIDKTNKSKKSAPLLLTKHRAGEENIETNPVPTSFLKFIKKK